MSAWTPNYREKVEAVRDSITALLDDSVHEGWIGLRGSLGTVIYELAKDDRERGEPARSTYRQSPTIQAADDRRDEVWRGLTQDERDALLLGVLTDEGLTISEWTDLLDDSLKTPECGTMSVVYGTQIRSMVSRLMRTGKLQRVAETYRAGSSKVRYRYSLARPLQGPIADLERAYHEDND